MKELIDASIQQKNMRFLCMQRTTRDRVSLKRSRGATSKKMVAVSNLMFSFSTGKYTLHCSRRWARAPTQWVWMHKARKSTRHVRFPSPRPFPPTDHPQHLAHHRRTYEHIHQSVGPCNTLDQETKWSAEGVQLYCGTWEYKLPTAYDIPLVFNVSLLKNSPNPHAVCLGSKAVAEPAMSLILSPFLAVKKAIYAARRELQVGDDWFQLDAPLSPRPSAMLLASVGQAWGCRRYDSRMFSSEACWQVDFFLSRQVAVWNPQWGFLGIESSSWDFVPVAHGCTMSRWWKRRRRRKRRRRTTRIPTHTHTWWCFHWKKRWRCAPTDTEWWWNRRSRKRTRISRNIRIHINWNTNIRMKTRTLPKRKQWKVPGY